MKKIIIIVCLTIISMVSKSQSIISKEGTFYKTFEIKPDTIPCFFEVLRGNDHPYTFWVRGYRVTPSNFYLNYEFYKATHWLGENKKQWPSTDKAGSQYQFIINHRDLD